MSEANEDNNMRQRIFDEVEGLCLLLYDVDDDYTVAMVLSY